MFIEKLSLSNQDRLLRFLFRGETKIQFFQRLKDGEENGQQVLMTLKTMLRYYHKKKRYEAILVERILDNFHRGQSVVNAMKDYIDGVELITLQAGEQIGLSDSLSRCITLEERKMGIRSLLIGKLWAPVAKILLLIVALWALGAHILPDFLSSMGELPSNLNAISTALFSLVTFVNSAYAPLGLIGFFGVIYLFFFSLKRWTGPIREKFDEFSPYSLYRIMTGTAWLSSVSIMISSGLTVRKALENTKEMSADNKWLNQRISAILDRFGSASFGLAVVESGYAFPDRNLVDEMEILAEQGVDNSRYLKLADTWAQKGVEAIGFQIEVFSKFADILFYGIALLLILGMLFFVQDVTNASGGVL